MPTSEEKILSHFKSTISNIEDNPKLREPQRQAHRECRLHFEKSSEPVVLQIPVGCGKTGVIATLPYGISDGRTLIIAPNVTIRNGISEALDIASPKCFWTKTRCLTDFRDGPFTAILDGPNANIYDCHESHFVITNIQQLASSADRWLPQFPPDFFDMILVDEGHHSAADSWRKVFNRFPNAKVVNLTATPFRSDDKTLEGEIVYRYPFRRAMVKGYIKEIHAINLVPSELSFTYKGSDQRHSLEEVLALREEAWFRKGVALAPECNQHIAQASIQYCQKLRQRTGTRHQIIAVACTVDHARQVRSIYEQNGIKAAEIHSHMDDAEKDRILCQLRENLIDCIVQVQMLGEGFDHPPLSIAAVFRPFRSLSPYIQFVGRIMRVIHEASPGHADNHGYIVSHVGLNNEERWQDFRLLDDADQEMVHSWLAQESDENGAESRTGNGHPRRFDVGMKVKTEVIESFFSNSFLDPDDDAVIDEMLGQPIANGLTLADIIDRETLRETLRQKQMEHAGTPTPVPINPQRKRKAARTRLNERTKSVATRVLADLKLQRTGYDIFKAKATTQRGTNANVLIRLLHDEVNAFLDIDCNQRDTLPLDKLESGLDNLDTLGDNLRNRIQKQLERNKNAPS